MVKFICTPEMSELITQITKNGNTAEIKRENNKYVIVEIKRKMKIKTPING